MILNLFRIILGEIFVMTPIYLDNYNFTQMKL